MKHHREICFFLQRFSQYNSSSGCNRLLAGSRPMKAWNKVCQLWWLHPHSPANSPRRTWTQFLICESFPLDSLRVHLLLSLRYKSKVAFCRLLKVFPCANRWLPSRRHSRWKPRVRTFLEISSCFLRNRHRWKKLSLENVCSALARTGRIAAMQS